jgi:hypothetical protein
LTIEDLKLIGAIAGLLTLIFTVWDRLLRGRPIAYLVVKGRPSNHYEFLHIKNIDSIDILIIGIKAWPRFFKAAKDDNAITLVNAGAGEPLLVLLSPGEEREFPFFKSGGQSTEGSCRITIAVRWRKSTSTWFPQIPKMIFTSTEDIDRMARGL